MEALDSRRLCNWHLCPSIFYNKSRIRLGLDFDNTMRVYSIYMEPEYFLILLLQYFIYIVLGIGFTMPLVAIYRFRNPLIWMHFFSPIMGLNLWLILLLHILTHNKTIIFYLLIYISILFIPKTTKNWTKTLLKAEC